MSIAAAMLPEYDQEMANTRKVLERIPDNKLDWKAHPRSNTIGWVAAHLVEMAGWIEGTLAHDQWDLNPPGGEPYQTPQLQSTKEILDTFDANVVAGRKALEAADDRALLQEWSLLSNGETLFRMPRIAAIRTFVLNHSIHHRAFLCAYLRLNNIPVPGMYGPSGDE